MRSVGFVCTPSSLRFRPRIDLMAHAELVQAKDVEAVRGFKLNGVIRAANSFPPHALVLASSEP